MDKQSHAVHMQIKLVIEHYHQNSVHVYYGLIHRHDNSYEQQKNASNLHTDMYFAW